MKPAHLWISVAPGPGLPVTCPTSPKPDIHPHFQTGTAPSLRHRTPFSARRLGLVLVLVVCAAVVVLVGPFDPAGLVAGLVKEGSAAFSRRPSSFGLTDGALEVQAVPDAHAQTCQDWDPDAPELDDPADCLNVRQYRQIQRALQYMEREWTEEEMWTFALEHNLQALRKLSACFLPEIDPLHAACPARPLVISGFWWTATQLDGDTAGEAVWQGSLVKQIEALGLHWIAVGGYERWIEVAELMPDVYRVIWLSDVDIVSCSSDPRCIAKEHYNPPVGSPDLSFGVTDEERGVIPLYALTAVDYWGARPRNIANDEYWWGLKDDGEWSFHPLGHQWIATPFPLPSGHVHLPYSIEDKCTALPYRSHAERNESVLLFAKQSSHFHEALTTDPAFFTQLADGASFDVVTTAQSVEGQPVPAGLKSLGRQSRPAYDELLSSVKAVIGIGFPYISPTVYSALCQGTPVIVPYFNEQPRSEGWWLYGNGDWQHGPAAAIGPPYVYSYYSKDYASLERAVKQAMETPIERYIPPDMKLEYTMAALRAYLDRDAKAMFSRIVIDNDGNVPPLAQGLLERCYELGRCQPRLPAGRRPYSMP